MKKLKKLMAFIMVALVCSESVIVNASEIEEVSIIEGELVIRELPLAEVDELLTDISEEMISQEITLPMASTASYTAYEYSRAFDLYLNGTWVAQANAVCVVWHYTDGKVHLYQREITVRRLATYDASRTYGRIVNTDGSLSYTTGDRVHLYSLTNSWDFAIDFRVTPTEASFDCYEV